MSVGIVVSIIGNFGEKGFYNSQEVGLAKSIAKSTHDKVIIYKLIAKENITSQNVENISENVILKSIPSKHIGTHGLLDTSILDDKLSMIICFSDIQLSYPILHRWCKKRGIQLLPYVGRIDSTSNSFLKRCFTNIVAKTNINLYKKQKTYVKTPFMRDEMNKCNINDTVVAPVGLDLDLLKRDCDKYSLESLKSKLGFEGNDKIVLFVGRLVKEKNPIYYLELIEYLREQNENYKLLMIGDGELFDEINTLIKQKKLSEYIHMERKVPNSKMWMYYRISDALVNLCQNEIFGMAILEAMFYECPVIALKAPGPNYIIQNRKNGFLIENMDKEEIYKCMNDSNLNEITNCAKNDILEKFSWDSNPIVEEARYYEENKAKNKRQA